MTKERLRRTDPERSQPIRDWEQLFRRPDADAEERTGSGTNAESDGSSYNGANGKAWDAAVTDAVKLGYRIIEDQINQGKRAAEQFSERSDASSSIGGDVSEFVRRLLQFYSDIGASCFDFIDSLTRSNEFQANVRDWVDESLATPAAASPEGAAAPDVRMQIPIDIRSSQPVLVTVEVVAGAGRLGVHGLHGIDPAYPPLRDVNFTYDGARSGPVLRIRIPDGQPAGTYTGAVVDADNNQPRGTLCVQIADEVAVAD